jgi:hypothetical protein
VREGPAMSSLQGTAFERRIDADRVAYAGEIRRQDRSIG